MLLEHNTAGPVKWSCMTLMCIILKNQAPAKLQLWLLHSTSHSHNHHCVAIKNQGLLCSSALFYTCAVWYNCHLNLYFVFSTAKTISLSTCNSPWINTLPQIHNRRSFYCHRVVYLRMKYDFSGNKMNDPLNRCMQWKQPGTAMFQNNIEPKVHSLTNASSSGTRIFLIHIICSLWGSMPEPNAHSTANLC